LKTKFKYSDKQITKLIDYEQEAKEDKQQW
jgi:hypothetical protein